MGYYLWKDWLTFLGLTAGWPVDETDWFQSYYEVAAAFERLTVLLHLTTGYMKNSNFKKVVGIAIKIKETSI